MSLLFDIEPPPEPDPDWTRPAAERGLTPAQVVKLFGRPMREVWAVYVYGGPNGEAPIGRPDPYHCWYALPGDVDAAFGGGAEARKAAGLARAFEDRTAARRARRQARLAGANVVQNAAPGGAR